MRTGKSLAAVALAVVITAVAATAPAGAAEQASFCDPLRATTFGASSGVAARGGEIREPADLGVAHSDLPASAKGKAGKRFSATVPVYFHVVTDGATGAVTDAQVAAQIAVLNTTFGGGEGGANTGFHFVLAGLTRTDNAAWFYGKLGGTTEQSMKRTLRSGGDNALNIYSTTADKYLGWAYFPDILTKPGQADLDGIVINWETIPGVSATWAGRYDQGETATHEAGHWLMLEHTFQGGCSANGDFVSDTPPMKTPTSGCPAGKDTCREPGLDPIHNYMDYSYDNCYTEFTAGQTQRMRDAWLAFRAP